MLFLVVFKVFHFLQIRVRPSVREVVANYTLDDGSMELVIQQPANFPLGQVTVESGKKVGVGTAQWRNWMLQLTTFLQVRRHHRRSTLCKFCNFHTLSKLLVQNFGAKLV